MQDKTHSLGIRLRPTYATRFLAKPAAVRRSAGVTPAPNCECAGPRSSSSSSCANTQRVEAGTRHTHRHTRQCPQRAACAHKDYIFIKRALFCCVCLSFPAGQRTCGTVTGASIMGCPLMLMNGTPPKRCDRTQPQLSLCGIGSATPMTASACRSLSAWGRVRARTEAAAEMRARRGSSRRCMRAQRQQAAAGDVCVLRGSRQQQDSLL